MKVNNFKDFKGKVISEIRHMDEAEQSAYGWDKPGIAIEFTDKTWMVISQDEEGNGPGAVFTADSVLC